MASRGKGYLTRWTSPVSWSGASSPASSFGMLVAEVCTCTWS